FRSITSMPGFTHIAALPTVAPGAIGVTPIDFDGDGKIDLLLYGANRISLIQNAGGSLNEVRLPMEGGARAAAWADYNGDGKPDMLLAAAFRGLRLYRNIGATTAVPLEISFSKWQQCGPFDNTGNRGFDAVYPPENGFDAKGEYPGKNNQKATWREVEFPEGALNSVKIYREEDHTFM